jgi:large conductance mechanosensitive channel
MSLASDFRDFVIKGNVIQLAIAFVMGAAFSGVVTAFTGDIINPLIGLPGHTDFSRYNYTVPGTNSTFGWGLVVTAIINFFIIATILFFAVVRPLLKIEERRKARAAAEPATTRTCPFCLTTVPIGAARCPACTSNLPAAEEAPTGQTK